MNFLESKCGHGYPDLVRWYDRKKDKKHFFRFCYCFKCKTAFRFIELKKDYLMDFINLNEPIKPLDYLKNETDQEVILHEKKHY